MTQEEKSLLLKDLCARLPYRVKVLVKGEKYFNKIKEPYIVTLSFGTYLFDDEDITLVPYLRPMSSMTEEEIDEYHKRCEFNDCDYTGEPMYFDTLESFDYLHSIHVDCRGLIHKGLALEAPKDMYKSE